ncbi:CLAVATA3/ESR-RELATED 6 [Quillaja saponaria]|uniref:CLAVATA3/ESR-RELATED 6 n=1 Tax=Quillaja saponaria TaxID=32244 RepID=A0AAD7PB67_QUISA|nr:CLAVATA3/ESR-RELATED 6 [Quillaja saponaria]
MANPTARNFLVLLVVVFTLLVAGSESRELGLKGVHGHVLLQKLGYDRSRLDFYRRIYRRNSQAARISPGGPDGQHHMHSPSLT